MEKLRADQEHAIATGATGYGKRGVSRLKRQVAGVKKRQGQRRRRG